MIPQRYKNVKYEDVRGDIREKFERMSTTRKGLYIYGTVGTGKTHTAYALSESAKEKTGLSARIYNTTELFMDMRKDINREPAEKKNLDKELMEYEGILVLDDIGAEKLSDWVFETFYLILNKRYNDMTPTIFTSNYSIEELSQRIGDRTTSRIVEMCDIVRLDGKDRRLPQ